MSRTKRSRQGRRVRRERHDRLAKGAAGLIARMIVQKDKRSPSTGAAAPEKKLDARCPECDGPVVGKGGRWRCVRSRKRFNERRFRPGQDTPERVKSSAVRYLRCGASGTVMRDGSLAVLVGGALRKKEVDG